MRGHVVRAFDGMAVALLALRNEAFEEIAEVERYIRIGVLLNHQRAGGVLNEYSQKAIVNAGLSYPFCDGACERIQAFSAS